MASTASPEPTRVDATDDAAFWTRSLEDCIRTLDCGRNGLTSQEAEARLARFGPNSDKKGKRETALHAILRRLLEPLSLILFGAGLVSIATGDAVGGAIIVTILVISIGLDTFQEGHAAGAADDEVSHGVTLAKHRSPGASLRAYGKHLICINRTSPK
ncbi:cation-transporting P-type ATPase [Labrys neptuniae]